ncbi:MAG: hypothetical protein ACRCV0_07710 [Brevinema sp.]
MRVLFSDNLHLNNKNFASLLSYLNQVGAVITHPNFNNDSICRFGDYSQWKEIVSMSNDMLHLSADDLMNVTFKGINLFDVSYAELMSKCSTKEHWINSSSYGLTKKELIEKLLVNDKDDLLLNIAAAKHWVNYWFSELASKTFDFIFIFSGSLIYASSLVEIMKGFQGRVFIFESFFTGRHYYCEEKYSHLPNNTDAKFKSQLYSRTAPGALIDQTRLERGIKESLNTKNKNVSQPTPVRKKLFNNKKKSILIGGQVLNDFSLLKTGSTGIHSISTYKNLIEQLLDKTDLNVIFKAHPWENKKSNLLTSKTKDFIHSHFSNSPRVLIVEDYSIFDLFSEVDYVVVINSQLGIEAALQGFKPIQIGNAFYGNYGFTHDINNVDSIVKQINNGLNGLLSIDEYILLREYLMHMLVDYLVPEDTIAGIAKLKQIFNITQAKKQPTPVNSMNKTSSKETKIKKKNSDTSISKKIKKLKENPKRFFSDSKYRIFKAIGKTL